MPKRLSENIKFLPKGRIETPGLTLTDALAFEMATTIKQERLSPGLLLPPIRNLAERHKVGIITVKRALEKLLQSGLVESIPRIGYRVANRKEENVKKIGIIYKNLHLNQGSSLSIDNIERVIRSRNQVLMIGSSNGQTSQENECIKRFKSAGMDGLIIAPAFTGEKSTELEKWIREGKPTVLEGHTGSWKISKKMVDKCPQIDFDNEAGMILLLEYLWSLGHRHFLLASSDINPKSIRQQTFVEFIQLKGLKPELIVNNEDKIIRAITSKIESKKHNLSAIVCTDDHLALQILDKLSPKISHEGLNISITGFGNQANRPINNDLKLTTIHYSLEELAIKISESLNMQFEMSGQIIKTTLIPPQLIIGNTCKPVLVI